MRTSKVDRKASEKRSTLAEQLPGGALISLILQAAASAIDRRCRDPDRIGMSGHPFFVILS
jgi:hypothetical protein